MGAAGSVTGVDMTEPQLAVARKHADAWATHLGYPAPNMRFVQGRMEDLREAGIAGACFAARVALARGALTP